MLQGSHPTERLVRAADIQRGAGSDSGEPPALLGNCPPKLTTCASSAKRFLPVPVLPLGDLFTAFDPLAKPSGQETEALSMATALATLAIETRRLYSDLLHRSEFDLLTDIHNRFSLDKHLDAQIEKARRKAGIFGLIYIDLDEFKQVNDLWPPRWRPVSAGSGGAHEAASFAPTTCWPGWVARVCSPGPHGAQPRRGRGDRRAPGT